MLHKVEDAITAKPDIRSRARNRAQGSSRNALHARSTGSAGLLSSSRHPTVHSVTTVATRCSERLTGDRELARQLAMNERTQIVSRP